MGRSPARPAGADDFLKWRRSIDEHLELGRLTWDEYAMFSWLCTKADPHTGRLRTSWTIVGSQTRLPARRVEQLCRRLKAKGYIGYAGHGGRRALAEVAIDKFPLRDGTYTSLAERGASGRVAPAEVQQQFEGSSARKDEPDSRRVRVRERTTSLRVRKADLLAGTEGSLQTSTGPVLPRDQALAAVPRALRETVELFWLKTGRDGLTPDDLAALSALDQAHTPAVIQKAITESVTRFRGRGDDPRELTLRYVWESLQHFATRKGRTPAGSADPIRPAYPPGLTRLP